MSGAANKDDEGRTRQEHGWFASKAHSYAELLKHPLVASWIQRYHEGESQESYARALKRILDGAGVTIDAFLALSPDDAKKIVFSIADAEKKRGRHAQARKTVIAAKGFFEANKKTFDLDRLEKKRYYSIPRKKVIDEIIPNKDQVYRMADASLSLKAGLRNKAMILCLLQSGVRPGCLCRWTYRLIREQLYPEVKVPVKLVITSETDSKLQSYGLDYYITFLQRDAAEALKSYLDYRIHQGWTPKDNDPVFVTESTASRGEPLSTGNIWEVVKQVAPAAGIDSHGMWSRLLRKAFRKVLNQSDIDEDTKEAIMGHKLPGSRGNYFDGHDHDEIAGKYMRCQFDRTAPADMQRAILTAELHMLMRRAKHAGLEREFIETVEGMLGEKKVPRMAGGTMEEYYRRMPFDAHDARDLSERLDRAGLLEKAIEAVTDLLERPAAARRGSKRRLGATALNGGTPIESPFETRIVSEKELVPLLDQGWDVVTELASGKIIVRRPNSFDE
jgi:integrase